MSLRNRWFTVIALGLTLVSVPLWARQMTMGRMDKPGQMQMPMGQSGTKMDQPGMKMGGECPMMQAMHGDQAMAEDAGLEKVFAAIGVTEAQRDKMKAVRVQHQAEIDAFKAKAEAAKADLQKAVRSLGFDEAAVRVRSEVLAGVVTDASIAETRIRAEAFKVLTLDQQKKAAAIQKLQKELAELLKPIAK